MTFLSVKFNAYLLNHGSPTCGPPGCIMRPAATFLS